MGSGIKCNSEGDGRGLKTDGRTGHEDGSTSEG